MAGLYDDQIVKEIQSRLDIVEIIAETVNLSRKNNRYWGLCPFHSEKTPSFTVNKEKNMFYCFGCHAGGDIITFVMQRDGLDFKAALQMLAAKAGIITESPADIQRNQKKEQVLKANTRAGEFYHEYLLGPSGKQGYDYLESRGITRDSIKRFTLGLAPAGWHNLEEYLVKHNCSREVLQMSGLVKISSDSKRGYDLFRERIIFPIYAYNGELVGFGGRVLDDSQPKYLNTAETEFFAKRKNLYGLWQGKEAIRKENQAILVEGYLDCIKLHQYGIGHTVASLGTAFTVEQAQLLKRYTENIIILFDGDEAGQREMLKATEVLTAQNLQVYLVTLPAGTDPDEFVDLQGKKGFMQYIQNYKLSHIEFKLDRFINEEKELDLSAQIRVINRLTNDLSALNSEVERAHYLRIMSRKLLLPENIIRKELNITKDYSDMANKRNKSEIFRNNIIYGNYSLEEKILASMWNDPAVFKQVQNAVGINIFAETDHNRLAQLFEQIFLQNSGDPDLAMTNLARVNNLASKWARLNQIIQDNKLLNQIEVQTYIRQIKFQRLELKWQQMFSQIKKLEEQGDFDSLLRFILRINTFIDDVQEGGAL